MITNYEEIARTYIEQRHELDLLEEAYNANPTIENEGAMLAASFDFWYSVGHHASCEYEFNRLLETIADLTGRAYGKIIYTLF